MGLANKDIQHALFSEENLLFSRAVELASVKESAYKEDSATRQPNTVMHVSDRSAGNRTAARFANTTKKESQVQSKPKKHAVAVVICTGVKTVLAKTVCVMGVARKDT